ncbi:MAG: hypothetical protein U0790_17705 [Isosphaeraceae bacterium]
MTVKKRAKTKEDGFEEQLFWFLATAYLADCVELLSPATKLKLAHLNDQYGCETSWQQQVEGTFGIDATFVKTVFTLCTERGKTEAQALRFMLQGFGCPEPEERMQEVLS